MGNQGDAEMRDTCCTGRLGVGLRPRTRVFDVSGPWVTEASEGESRVELMSHWLKPSLGEGSQGDFWEWLCFDLQ